MLIRNRWDAFRYDDFKLEDWRSLLDGVVTYEQAKANLDRYSLNPNNQFPPHPGVLAEKATQRAVGPAVPNAEETRKMLDHQEQELLRIATEPPEAFREALRRLGTKPLPGGNEGSTSQP